MEEYLTVKSPLDRAVARGYRFNLIELSGYEGICTDFEYVLKLCTPERLNEEEFNGMTGERLTAVIRRNPEDDDLDRRYINGIIYRIRELGVGRRPRQKEVWHYEVELSSWFRQLDSVKDCRIFQKKNNTNLSIAADLLREATFNDFRDETKRKPSFKPYITQYNESTHAFITRLLQDAGVFWRFEHRPDKHVLVFFDDLSAFPEAAGTGSGIRNHTFKFQRCSHYIPTEAFQSASFDYRNPPVKSISKPDDPSKTVFRTFSYPGRFESREEGDDRTIRERAASNSERNTCSGVSGERILQAGIRYDFKVPVLPDIDQTLFVITELWVKATPENYENRFSARPISDPPVMAPLPESKRPHIYGHQTATVIGEQHPSGVHSDDQARVRVRFHWGQHRDDDYASSSSAFIRNAQPAAGSQRGILFSPKIGEEVIVAFEDGDPDKPLIVGRLYSVNHPLPVSPEKDPWQSCIQADGARDASRILFDDGKGSENLEFRARKDMNIAVGSDLCIEVHDELTFLADNMEITANGNILTGNVVMLSGGDITSTAGKTISNTTGLVVAGIVGGICDKKAGGNEINIALGMVNTSSGGDTSSASAMIFNTTAGNIEQEGKTGVKNTGKILVNTAFDMIENASAKTFTQKADLAVMTNTETESNSFDRESKTESLLVKDKAVTVINE